jgi:RNA 2',3'-cyclic 3'-phosphodiesterase
MGGPLRLFVALYPPEEARRQMLRALDKLDPPPDARRRDVPLEQVHMTLQFIGDTPDRELPDVIESVRRSIAGLAPFTLTPTRLVTFPDRGLPRLIAVETDAPAGLLEAQRRLAQRLARSPRARAGDRFRPHLTVCRFTGSAKPKPVDSPARLPSFPVDRIILVRSVLKPTGAEHLPVEAVALG